MFYDEPSNYLDQLPERLQGIVEINAIAGSVDFEIDKLSAAIKKAVNNKFPSTADEDGCARWEKMLAISQAIDQFKNASASGNTITIENLIAPVAVTKARITGQTVQAGIGDPSPDNVRALHSTTSLTVSDGGSNIQTVTLPKELFSAPDGTADSYDAASGAGTQNVGISVLNGTENISFTAQNNGYARFKILSGPSVGGAINTANCICDTFLGTPFNVLSALTAESASSMFYDAENRFDIAILKSRLTGWDDNWTGAQKASAFKAWLSANPVTVLYKLAAPQTISGTAQNISGYAPKTVLSACPAMINAAIRSFDSGATLQARRDAIRAKIITKPPINLRVLQSIVEAYMGLGADVSLDGYQVHIKYRGESRIADLNPLYATMWKAVPANMLVDIAYAYLTWDELDAQSLTFDQLDAKSLTMNDFEKGEWIS